jgi:hypothetical protein
MGTTDLRENSQASSSCRSVASKRGAPKHNIALFLAVHGAIGSPISARLENPSETGRGEPSMCRTGVALAHLPTKMVHTRQNMQMSCPTGTPRKGTLRDLTGLVQYVAS